MIVAIPKSLLANLANCKSHHPVGGLAVLAVAAVTITQSTLGSIVEAREGKVLPVYAQSCVWRARGRRLQLEEMSKKYANERNRAWSVRHDS